jgi:hypothetical protein
MLIYLMLDEFKRASISPFFRFFHWIVGSSIVLIVMRLFIDRLKKLTDFSNIRRIFGG